jgi:hypothetical protein
MLLPRAYATQLPEAEKISAKPSRTSLSSSGFAAFQKLLPGKVIDFNIASGSDNRHQLFGNRARRTAIALADVRDDDDWSNALPTGYGRLIEVLSGFLARRYGYVRSGP